MRVLGFWRNSTGRCEHCRRATKKQYEVREGPAKGRYCGRFCYEKAIDEEKTGVVKEKPEVAY